MDDFEIEKRNIKRVGRSGISSSDLNIFLFLLSLSSHAIMEEKHQQTVVSPTENSGIIEAPIMTNGSSISTTAAATPTKDNDDLQNSSSSLSTEKPDLEQTESKGLEEHAEKKKLKKEKVGRILTFIGLQVSLFLAALDK